MAGGAWNRAILTGVVVLDPQSVGNNPFSSSQGKSYGGQIMKYDPKVLESIQESGLFGA